MQGPSRQDAWQSDTESKGGTQSVTRLIEQYKP
jgi:hypothetical protein